MRIGPGGGGSSTSRRVKVSKSRIGPRQRLVLRQGLQDRGKLRAAVAAGQRQTDRLQVAADGLQLAEQLFGRLSIEAVAGSCAQLLEPLERRPGVRAEVGRLRFGDLASELARLVQVARAAQRGDGFERSAGD